MKSFVLPARLEDFSLDDQRDMIEARKHYQSELKLPCVLELGPGMHGSHIRDRVKLGLNPQADPDCEIYWDLNYGIPLPDDSVKHIHSNQVLEHIHNIIYLFNDMCRVLTPGGTMEHCVPLFPGPHSVSDPTHVRFFNPLSFRYFCLDDSGEPFTAHFSDYGITSRFILKNQIVREGLDLTAFFEKAR